jgi:hypothetical protein
LRTVRRVGNAPRPGAEERGDGEGKGWARETGCGARCGVVGRRVEGRHLGRFELWTRVEGLCGDGAA